MIKLCTLLFLLFVSGLVFAQPAPDSIFIKKSGKQNTFYFHGTKLTVKQLRGILQDDPEALHEYKIANKNYLLARIMSTTGGVLIGVNLGSLAGSGKADGLSAGIGAGLIVVAIPFVVKANRHLLKAVKIYNAHLNYHSCNRFSDKPSGFKPFVQDRLDVWLQSASEISMLQG